MTRHAYGLGGPQKRRAFAGAEANGFDVFLTGDQTLAQEQSLSGRPLAVVALSAIQLPIIRENLPKIIAAIDNAAPGFFQIVECGTFRRKKPPPG
ncbi:MAG TPA: hypothetical protein VH640_13260 [Bryobacteraceae bacterium]